MKILFIGSGNSWRLPLAEYVLRKKLKEANVTGVEVESAETSDLGVASQEICMETKSPEAVPPFHDCVKNNATTDKVLGEADLIIVMEKKQRDFLTKFLDYSNWNRIHLFLEYCFGRNENMFAPDNNQEIVYDHAVSQIEEGCENFVMKIIRTLQDKLNAALGGSPDQQLSLG